MGKRKRIVISNEQEDRITSLPRPLMGCILDHMSAMDAARTTILSKDWRHLWSETPNLVFDDVFVNYRPPENYAETVTNILSSHTGPIHKFVIHVKLYILYLASYIDRWMLTLSKNRLKKLCIHNICSDQPYKVPSFVLDCPELTHLQLSGCVLDSECYSKSKLVYVYLEKIEVTEELVKALLLPTIETLRDLVFVDCTRMNILTSIRVPNLRSFRLLGSSMFNWDFFENNPTAEFVTIKGIQKLGENPPNCGTIGFTKLFDILGNTRDLRLNGSSLKFLAANGVPEVLPNVNNQLTKLCSREFRFYRMDQVSSALCIIRSSPNLKCLEISVGRNRIKVMDLEPEDITSVLENPGCMNGGRLRMVKMEGLNGLKGELLFIKLVLLHSPELKCFRLDFIRNVNQEKIEAELLQYPRASAAAEIDYNVKDKEIDYDEDDDVDINYSTDKFFV